MLEIHDCLVAASLPHAFGGAIALAYCTEEPRATRDLDLNVFVKPARAKEVLAALAPKVLASASEVQAAERDGEARVRWESTPVHIFFDTLHFHSEVARSVREVPFMDRSIPVVGCAALAVFKALLDRTKDWADIEAMVEAGAMSTPEALTWITGMVGSEHPAARRMAALGD
jgi:hypothetical protein